LDKRGNAIRFTLLRYLTSVGLRKDAASLRSLSDEEIRHIEDGIANVRQLSESSLENRLRTIIWEIIVYKTRGDISGHSVMQRLEFWKAGHRIIVDNFWIGTGTGDIQQAYQQEYIEMNTNLAHQYRWRAHNQYLSIFATFGIFGLLWFLFALVYPGCRLKMFRDYFYLIFFLILILSMLSEDTIENQAGATFFAFFTAFFLFAREQKMLLFTKKTIQR
jgi:O-antigen ligase